MDEIILQALSCSQDMEAGRIIISVYHVKLILEVYPTLKYMRHQAIPKMVANVY
jgi:hypothetical protein